MPGSTVAKIGDGVTDKEKLLGEAVMAEAPAGISAPAKIITDTASPVNLVKIFLIATLLIT